MIHGILAIAGVPFPQRVLKFRLGTRALPIAGGGNVRELQAASGPDPLGVSAPLVGNPVVDVRRTMHEADPSGLTRAEETHRVDVHQTQFL